MATYSNPDQRDRKTMGILTAVVVIIALAAIAYGVYAQVWKNNNMPYGGTSSTIEAPVNNGNAPANTVR